jgi:hypothetical protein
MVKPFAEKACFVWNDSDMGTPEQVARQMHAAGFEAAHLHSVNVGIWRTPSRVALVHALKALGLKVYASAAVYGNKEKYGKSPIEEGLAAAGIVNQYGLDGFVFDVEKGLYETAANAPDLVRDLFRAYGGATDKPSAMCWWFFWRSPVSGTQWHNPKTLLAGLEYAAVGMPMAYWFWGNNPASAVRFLDEVWKQWREITDKPIVVAGRAYHGDGGMVYADAVTEYEQRARELGAVGLTWWVAEHAYKIPDVWQALTETPRFGEDEQEEPVMTWKDNAIGLITTAPDERENWDGFHFIAGVAGFGDSKPNEQLKPIEAKATGKGLPFGVIWDNHPQFYLDSGYPMDADLWPKLEQDAPYQMIVRAIQNRDCKFVVLRFEYEGGCIDMSNGKPVNASMLSFCGQMLAGRIKNWCAEHKPGCKVMIGASYDWIKEFGDGGDVHSMLNWVDQYPQWITQTAATEASYPLPDDKPGWLSAEDRWHFWAYHPILAIYRWGVAALYGWLGFDGTVPPVEPPVEEPEPEPVTKIVTVATENGNRLNFRAGPVIADNSLELLPDGTQLIEVGRQGDWVNVLREGWVHKDWVE